MCDERKNMVRRQQSLGPQEAQREQEQEQLQRSRSMELPEGPIELEARQNDWDVLEQENLVGARFKCREEFTGGRTDWSRGSEDMIRVQGAVRALAETAEQRHALRTPEDVQAFCQNLDQIENQYLTAIEDCSIYIKNKKASYFPYNKIRYNAVKNTLDRLTQELNTLSAIRKNLTADPAAYQNRQVSFTDLAYEWQGRNEGEDPVGKLTLKDYVKVISKSEGEAMVCKNGRLYRQMDEKAGRDAALPTRENYRMAKHFVELLLEKENIASPKTRERISKNLLIRLGADLEGEISLPVSMAAIREIIMDADTRLSDLDNTLADQKKATPEYKIADQINQLLGKSLSASAQKKALEEQVKKLMAACEKSGTWKGAKLSKKDFQYLVNGGTELVREKAFAHALRIYKGKARLAGAEAGPVPVLSAEEMQILLGLAISEAVSENSVYQSLYAIRLNDFAEDQILKEDKALKEKLGEGRILEFGCFTASEIRLYFTHLPEKLQGMSVDDRRKGMEALCSITEHMQDLMQLEAKGIQQGLSAEERQQLEAHGAAIDALYQGQQAQIERLKNALSPAGGLRCGIQKLQDLYQKGGSITGTLTGNLAKLQAGAAEVQKDPESREVLAEYKAARGVIETMSEKAQTIAAVFLRDKSPSELIKRSGNTLSKEFIRLHDALAGLGEDGTVAVRIGGTTLTFSQKDELLTMKAGRKQVVLPYTAAYWTRELEHDICAHYTKYDKTMAKQLLSDMALRDIENMSDNRVSYEKFLTSHLNVKAKDLNLLTATELQRLVWKYCNTAPNAEHPELTPEVEVQNALNQMLLAQAEKVHINSKTALESLLAMQRMEQADRQKVTDKTKRDVNLGTEDVAWEPGQKKILDFMGELYFSSKAGSDADFAYTPERLKKIILANPEGFQNFRALMEDGAEEMEFASKLCTLPMFREAYLAVRSLVKGIADRNPANLAHALESGELNDLLNTAKDQMTGAVEHISGQMQTILKDSVDDLDAESDEDWKKLEDRSVSEILQAGMTGKEGEGAFNKKVLSGYIANAKMADKQNMIAAAFKNAPNHNGNAMSARQEQSFQGKFLSGYLKGAGPLLHKMMQGLPISNMPAIMQEAVKDVRSNLAPVDEELVDAELHSIIKASHGTIDRIEKVKILGKASVGQAVLVRMYEKGAAKGVEKVIKILRPDAANHMERELEFMQKCAREVDKEAYDQAHREQGLKADENYQGAMSRTFAGRVENIKKEFDLRLEAQNVELGKIYEDPILHISTMKADKKAEATTGMLVLERAPGVSVDRFISDQDKKRKEICDKSENESLYSVMSEMDALRTELKNKHKYLINLTGKWLEEALFGSGFFHGDLHAGNIMMDDNGVTVIDYGNVHKLETKEQGDILNLIAAMQSMNTQRFKEHLRNLLSPEAQTIYDREEEHLATKIRTIVKKDDNANAVEKILAVLTELQKDGIDIAPGLYNFIQCFVRIAGTLTDYDTLLDKTEGDMVSLMDKRTRRDLEKQPDDLPMYVISRNILERYEPEYKNANAKTLEETVHTAMDGKVANMTNVIKLCTKKSKYYMEQLQIDPQMERFSSLIESRKEVFMDRMMGMDANFLANAGMLITEMKYDSRVTEEQVKPKMQEVYKELQRVAANQKEMLRRKVESVDSNQRKVDNVERNKRNIAERIRRLEVVPENEKEADKKYREGSLDTWRHRLQNFDREMEIAADELRKDKELLKVMPGWNEAVDRALERIKNHLDGENYTKEMAQEDIKVYQASFEDELLYGLKAPEEQEEIDFLKAMAEVTCVSYRKPEEPQGEKLTEPEIITMNMPGSVKDIKMSAEDEQKRKRDEEAAIRKLEEAAERVYLKTDPKSYREQLAELLTNQAKTEELGRALQEWFRDEGGVSLREAFDAVKNAQAQGNLNAEAPEITAFVAAMEEAISRRAQKLDTFMKVKNVKTPADKDPMKNMVKGILKAHWIKTLWRLDGGGLRYLKENKLGDEEKAELERDRKERHTNFVAPCFASLEASGLKNHLRRLSELATRYKNGTNQEKETAIQDMNRILTQIMKLLTTDIRFRRPGKKLMQSLLEEYEEKPSGSLVCKILGEADKYIKELFANTSFKDKPAGEERRSSRFEEAYGEETLSREMLLIIRDIPSVKQRELAQNGGNPARTMAERMRDGDDISWIG